MRYVWGKDTSWPCRELVLFRNFHFVVFIGFASAARGQSGASRAAGEPSCRPRREQDKAFLISTQTRPESHYCLETSFVKDFDIIIVFSVGRLFSDIHTFLFNRSQNHSHHLERIHCEYNLKFKKTRRSWLALFFFFFLVSIDPTAPIKMY